MNKKNYVVILRFDSETDKKLNNLRAHLHEAGLAKSISEWPPHITIAAYEGVDTTELLRWTDDFAKK